MADDRIDTSAPPVSDGVVTHPVPPTEVAAVEAPRTGEPPPGVHRAVTPARHRSAVALTAVVLLLLPAAVAYIISSASPSVYEARAELLVSSRTDSSSNDQNIQTQLTLLTSKAVIGPVASAHGMSLTEVSSAVTADRENDSQLLEVMVKDRSASRAVDLTRSLLKDYLEVAQGATGPSAQVTFLQSRIQQLTASLEDIDKQIAAGQSGNLTTQRDLLMSQISTLQGQLTTAELGDVQASTPARIVTQAYSVSGAISPRPLRAALGGLLAGILLVALATYLYYRRNGRATGR